MRPTFEQFQHALRDPSARGAIGLDITDADAASLAANPEWASQYYTQWIALFPAAVDAAPEADERGRGLGALSAIVIGAAIVILIGVAAVALVVPALTRASASATVAHPTATPSPSHDAYGLTPTQEELVNASLASEGKTIADLAAAGATPEQITALGKLYVDAADLICTSAAQLPDGLETAGKKEAVEAGLEKGTVVGDQTVALTPAQAERVWNSYVAYCAS